MYLDSQGFLSSVNTSLPRGANVVAIFLFIQIFFFFLGAFVYPLLDIFFLISTPFLLFLDYSLP